MTSKLLPRSVTDLLADPQAIRRELGRRKLLEFTRQTMSHYHAGRHHRILCDRLDRFARGELKRLMVFMPPRHGKSELVSRRLPAFILGKNPDVSIIATSYSADLAQRMNRDVQRIIDSAAYRGIFPETKLWGRSNRAGIQGTYARNTDLFEIVGKRGGYRSAGVGGGITGMGFDFGIIDDPTKNREDADSYRLRDATYEWYTSTFYTRRSSGAGILLTTTRWNEDDLAGRLLKLAETDPKADQWEVLRFPAIATENPDPADWRQPGEALWPEKFPLEELEKTRAASEYEWHALYQQDPRPEGGSEWHPDHFTHGAFWFDDWPEKLVVRTLFLDPSKGAHDKQGDYSAYVRYGRDNAGVEYVDADLQRRGVDQIVADGIEHARQWNPDGFGVEGNAFQDLLAPLFRARATELRVEMPSLHLFTNTVNKLVRIRRLTEPLTQRKMRFRRTRGTQLLVDQLRQFPNAANDDGPDALEGARRLAIMLNNKRNAR
jgi:hypothetical protein